MEKLNTLDKCGGLDEYYDDEKNMRIGRRGIYVFELQEGSYDVYYEDDISCDDTETCMTHATFWTPATNPGPETRNFYHRRGRYGPYVTLYMFFTTG